MYLMPDGCLRWIGIYTEIGADGASVDDGDARGADTGESLVIDISSFWKLYIRKH